MRFDRAGDAARHNADLSDALSAQAADLRELVRVLLLEAGTVDRGNARMQADEGEHPDE